MQTEERSATVEELEAQHSDLRAKITRLAQQDRIEDEDGTPITVLIQNSAAMKTSIVAARTDHEAENLRAQQARLRKVEVDLLETRAACTAAREEFLERFQSTRSALSKYRALMNDVVNLTNQTGGPFGTRPEHLNAIKFLDLPQEIANKIHTLQ